MSPKQGVLQSRNKRLCEYQRNGFCNTPKIENHLLKLSPITKYDMKHSPRFNFDFMSKLSSTEQSTISTPR